VDKLSDPALRFSLNKGGKMNLKSIAIALSIALLFPTPASAATDPYPNLATGDELPGTRVWSTTETSWAEFATTTYRAGWACPQIATPNGDPYAMDGNGFDQATGKWYRACFKNTWRQPRDPVAWENYYNQLRQAQANAEAESRAWNEANPGKQKCVQWGPITDPDGGVSSGGVCANPVSSPTAPSGSQPVSAGSVSESDIVGSSNSSSISSSTSASISPDPIPSQTSSYRGSGYPYTVVIEGQVGISGCPVGFQAANGLIVVSGTGREYTECWPERAWTANRLGGEAWGLYKATGGSYDPSVEIDRRAKVELLKSKAKELASAAALQTPGIERCSAWSGFGEAGSECAYAFIRPNTVSGSVSTSSSVSGSLITTSSAVSAPATQSSSTSAGNSATSSDATSNISVALSSVAFKASPGVIAKTVTLLTASQNEASRISKLVLSVSSLKSTTKTRFVYLPIDKTLNYKLISLTPQVCSASTQRMNFRTKGLCQVRVSLTDSSGNTYEFVKRVRKN